MKVKYIYIRLDQFDATYSLFAIDGLAILSSEVFNHSADSESIIEAAASNAAQSLGVPLLCCELTWRELENYYGPDWLSVLVGDPYSSNTGRLDEEAFLTMAEQVGYTDEDHYPVMHDDDDYENVDDVLDEVRNHPDVLLLAVWSRQEAEAILKQSGYAVNPYNLNLLQRIVKNLLGGESNYPGILYRVALSSDNFRAEGESDLYAMSDAAYADYE
ncbi:hypothetical protein [Leptolyngbya sp. FACHB-261]|uniref:hypothetical protein n=1 Tax=Leptolyngbya sp. FACHB-261 TaxID=2692806 RepID=UPI001682C961|nr:hypothetical protein [Leptolyngbya sp. FACHB-261]MBD2104118.1 hypothetical protein [Leptolyngbya sp. FACHB-261]